MDALLIIIGMGLVTFLTRYVLIVALDRDVPLLLRNWLRYVPAAILAALIAPAALMPDGRLETGARALAVALGGLVAWRTRNVLLTILTGMAAFWLLRLVGLP